MKREYTREFKQEALRLCEEPGVLVKDIADDLGIRTDSLYRWRSEARRHGNGPSRATAC